jgi:hypothetical protein
MIDQLRTPVVAKDPATAGAPGNVFSRETPNEAMQLNVYSAVI